tara:strand:+ start:321 stop:491 length:171 start_codon:yes stop_codon:yes gene_type:complete
MLNKIYRIVDRIFEIIGYNFVGYKVDIKLLEERIKAVEILFNNINEINYINKKVSK